VLPDAPVPKKTVVPEGWSLSQSGIARVKTDANDEAVTERVNHGPILITGSFEDIATGKRHLTVAWQRGDHWNERVVGRHEISTPSGITQLAAYGAPANSLNAPTIVNFLHDFEAANIDHLPASRVSSRLGWQGDDGKLGFLCGEQFLSPLTTKKARQSVIRYQAPDDGDQQCARAFHGKGTVDGWREAVASLDSHPRVCAAIYGSLAAPMLTVLDTDNFIIEWAGRSSIGKTTALRVAASCWGNPNEKAPEPIIHNWNATATGLERLCANGLPFLVNETKLARQPKQIAAILYQLAEGHGRTRGTGRGLQNTNTFRTVSLITGEFQAIHTSQDGGTRARVISLRGFPFGEATDKTAALVEELNVGLREHYGHIGQLFVRHLLENRHLWPEWRAQFHDLHGYYMQTYGAGNATTKGVLDRLAKYLAVLQLTGVIANNALGVPFVKLDECLWSTIEESAEDSDEALRALRYLRSRAYENQHRFYKRHRVIRNHLGRRIAEVPPSRWLGVWPKESTWEWIGFLPGALRDLLRTGGFQPEAVIQSFYERGWLASNPGRGVQRRQRIPAEIKRQGYQREFWDLVAITRGVFENEETPESSDEVADDDWSLSFNDELTDDDE
jgi:hypothetical protein